ncbi:MAG TPA: hypothetical protein VGX91_12655 [Candidatus Cybelea sp.]|jgi:hypothetical protein|nr:hypothetical protein [Candidatus Cybelea sp.]
MENVHAERSAGWSVLCYVALLIVATFLTTSMPSIEMKASDAALAIDAKRFTLLWGAWLTFPAAAFFLWFLVGLRSFLTFAPGRQEGLPTFALIAGLLMVATSLWAAMLQSAAFYLPPETFQDNALVGIYDAFVFVQNGLGYGPVAIFLFAAAHSMRRHDSAPRWLATLGYVAAAGAAIATLSIFFAFGPMAPGGPAPGIIGAIPAAAFLVATGIVLIQSKRGSGAPSTSTAS